MFIELYELRALGASALAGLVCGVLGCFVLLRNMSLYGDALSHAVLPGVVLGFVLAGYSALAFFVGAVVAGLFAAVAITYLQRNVRTKQDAAIGVVFTTMFAIGVIGISYLSKGEGVHLDLKDFLFGNVLGVGSQDLWLTGLITAFVLFSVVVLYRYLFITTFQNQLAQTLGLPTGLIDYFLMLLLSFTVVAALQSVGVILVVAMLIIPASTAYLLAKRLKQMVIIAGSLGVLVTTLGYVIASVFDFPPGPAMTVFGAVVYGFAVIFAPNRGLIPKYFAARKRNFTIACDDVLKRIYQHNIPIDGVESLVKITGLSPIKVRRCLSYLTKTGTLSSEGLTEKGQNQAIRLLRAHRLWETYLHQTLNQPIEAIHLHAERLEHFTTDEQLAQIEHTLDNPQFDPHGQPIPPKR